MRARHRRAALHSSSGVHVGCSGWQHRHWRGSFYPADLPQRHWFAYYAARFDTVEINNTFYRWPEQATFKAWKSKAPRGFLYAVEGPPVSHPHEAIEQSRQSRSRDCSATLAFWDRLNLLAKPSTATSPCD
jgi:uncharacterized protein YecE (DUF72 family)